jgi:hypothetical protein
VVERWTFVNFCFGRHRGTMQPQQKRSTSVLHQLHPGAACMGCAVITLPRWRLLDCLRETGELPTIEERFRRTTQMFFTYSGFSKIR